MWIIQKYQLLKRRRIARGAKRKKITMFALFENAYQPKCGIIYVR